MATDPVQSRPGAPRALAAAWAGLWGALLLLALRLPPDGREHGDLGQFLGRLHPILVHGPVALLILVPVLELAGLGARRSYLRSAAGWILALAAAAALLAAFDGWLLAWSGGMRSRDVTRHMWGGVWLAGLSALAALARGRRPRGAYAVVLAGSVVLMVYTAHIGGGLTHGDGFLTEKMPGPLRSWLGIPAPSRAPAAESAAPKQAAAHGGPGSADPANPAFYSLHVAPILSRSCISCHRPEKHKGGLRMDSLALLLHGGEDGPVVSPGKPGSSDLMRRVKLPPSDDDYMPSDGEKPLTPEEIRTIERWIEAGAKGG
jgi:uncharacterized membrane protein